MNPEKKELYGAKRQTLIDLETNNIAAAWGKLRDDTDPTNWVLTVIDGNTKVVRTLGSGGGADGLQSMQNAVTDDDICFGGLRVTLAPGNRVKFFHVFVVGKDVSAMQKGKKIMFKNNILGSFDGAHGEINITTGTEGLDEELRRQITSLAGSDAWTVA